MPTKSASDPKGRTGCVRCWKKSACLPNLLHVLRLHCPAVSGSGSPLRGRWRANPNWSCLMSRRLHWTCWSQARVLALLADLRVRRNLTYAFITHDLSVVRNIADRIMVMEKGRVVEIEETVSLFRNPRHICTRRLIGAVPVIESDEIMFRDHVRAGCWSQDDTRGSQVGGVGRGAESAKSGVQQD